MTEATPEPASVAVSVTAAPLLARTVTLKVDEIGVAAMPSAARSRRGRDGDAQVGLGPDEAGEGREPGAVGRRRGTGR